VLYPLSYEGGAGESVSAGRSAVAPGPVPRVAARPPPDRARGAPDATLEAAAPTVPDDRLFVYPGLIFGGVCFADVVSLDCGGGTAVETCKMARG
jgi:hypothetical protein